MRNGARFLLSGNREIGKTSLLIKLKELAEQAGFNVKGVISPGVFVNGQKIGIDLLDLRSNQSVRLADLNQDGIHSAVVTEHWSFHPDGLLCGDEALANSVPCDLLIVDELGPLELERGQGWQNGVKAIDSQEYRAAVVVIRPELINAALAKWPDASVFTLAQKDQAEWTLLIEQILAALN